MMEEIRMTIRQIKSGQAAELDRIPTEWLKSDIELTEIWDMRMGDRPCEIYSVHEPFRSQLCMLYENDAIFDKFLCGWSDDDR
ncbi:unnamed protein product [Schistosoma curassoni]|uniref:DUF4314 domain-containing protein n=1 Tax=Schistosoma curassoni TaxID=6186 RepID=A0A183KS61_9TREM|nr:unnamed protein product [Schistosoma curassoni]